MHDEAPIAFRRLIADDLPMLREWLGRPHWRQWWGDPETELGFIRDMVEGRDSTQPFIVAVGGRAAGYIQVWFVRDARVEPWLSEAPWLRDLPEDAVGVDLSLADGECLGRGLGSAVLRAFVGRLRAEGHRTIIIDPDPRNRRAVRAYAKAGFRPIPALAGRTGDCLLMQHAEEATA